MGYAPDWRDKLICASFYLGVFINIFVLIPLVWMVVANLRRIHLKDFVKYHCYQAILLNMIIFFLPKLLGLLAGFLANLLSITVIFEQSGALLINLTNWFLPIYMVLIRVLALYAVIWTARGKFTYIPAISDAIDRHLR